MPKDNKEAFNFFLTPGWQGSCSASVSAQAILAVYGWHYGFLVSAAVIKYSEYSQQLPGEENGKITLYQRVLNGQLRGKPTFKYMERQ